MSSSSGGGEASRAAGGQVIVVHDAMEFSLASRSTEPTHIVLADHISFMVEFSDVPANAQAAIDVAVTEYIQSIRVCTPFFFASVDSHELMSFETPREVNRNSGHYTHCPPTFCYTATVPLGPSDNIVFYSHSV